MDEHNTDSDSHSVTSNHSTSSGTSSKPAVQSHAKEATAPPSKPASSKKRPQDDDGKVASTPKRKKTDGGDPSGAGGSTPGSSSRKAAPLSERQQMALALAMSAQESGGSSPTQSTSQPSVTPDSTPRSAMLRKVNRRNEKGESPLHLATIKGDVEGMKRLLKAGAGVNVPDYAGWTALHEACNHGFVNAARLLLKKGANVNAQGLDNDTPLHDAAINGHPELVALLLKYGANPHQANSKGESPLDVATNDDIIKLLKKETVFKLASDDSDTPASSPEGTLLPKDEEQPNTTLSDQDMQQLKSDISDPTGKLPVEPETRTASAALQPTSEPDNETVEAVDSTGSKPISRPSSTGFAQDLENTEDCKVSDGSDQPTTESSIDKQKEETAADTKQPAALPSEGAVSGDKETLSTPESITVRPETLVSMEGTTAAATAATAPLQTMDTTALAKSARQSLDFKPISAPNDVVAGAGSTGSSESPVSEGLSPAAPTQPSQTADTVGTSPVSKTTAAADNLSTSSPASEIPLSNEGDIEAEHEPMDMDDMPQPSTLPFSGGNGKAGGAKPPLSASVSTGFTESSNKATAPPHTNPTKEEKKKVERSKTPTPELSKECKPASPIPEKRSRTGSVHRKKRQTAQPSAVDTSAAGGEGDNSVDSTDSHMSSNSSGTASGTASGTTRSSRSRNKHSNQNPQATEEEAPPVRETRRKAMLKERAATNSPSAEKLAKSVSQKVPPLTIKIGSKSPVNTTKELPSASNTATASSADTSAPMPDKGIEKAANTTTQEQTSEDKAMNTQESTSSSSKEKKDRSSTPTPTTQSQQTATTTTTGASTTTTSGVTTRRTLRSHTNRNQASAGASGVSEKRESAEEPPAPPRKSKRMKQEVTSVPTSQPPASFPPPPGPMTIFNPYNLFKEVREQMCKKWERIVTVSPRAPVGYPNYLINTKKYLLLKNSSTNASKLAIPLLVAPSHLTLPMKEFFDKQEQERYKLRQQHIIEGEKLRIAYEQEIVRVHTRGVRAAANQETPLSVCTILKDKESGTVYHPFNALKDGGNGQSMSDDKPSSESRTRPYNNRQLISWLQDSEDKFEKLKDQMLSRHHHEAESLYAVQTMNWEWKLKECGLCDYKLEPTRDMLHVPMVLVNDDADILNST